jgi:thiol:disulfide interchange protein DsbC
MICQSFSTRRARAATLAALIVTAFALTALPASAQGTDKAAPMTTEAAGLKTVLQQKFPGAEIRGVAKSPYFGLYEVMFDDRIVYTDAKAKYVLFGAVYDTDSKTNLTEDRQRKLNRVNVAALPLDLAIKKVKGNGARKLVVFSDPDCPFCAQLEKTLKNIDNTTVYTFLFPIDQLHPEAARKSRKIWCAPDRQKAWDAHYDSGTLPDNPGECENPVAKTQALGASLKINATPTLIFADGSIVSGALPAERLEGELAKADAEVKRKPAANK